MARAWVSCHGGLLCTMNESAGSLWRSVMGLVCMSTEYSLIRNGGENVHVMHKTLYSPNSTSTSGERKARNSETTEMRSSSLRGTPPDSNSRGNPTCCRGWFHCDISSKRMYLQLKKMGVSKNKVSTNTVCLQTQGVYKQWVSTNSGCLQTQWMSTNSGCL